MKILVACEESQAVTIEFRKLGHEAYSCDIEPCSGGHPEWHFQEDVTPLLKQHWDMIIAHPPCTYLTNGGAVRMYPQKGIVDPKRLKKALKARDFFMMFYNADCERIAIENPMPMKIVELPEKTQVIQPYEYGDPYSKKTYLWLKGLPNLKPTNILSEYQPFINGGGGRLNKPNYNGKEFANGSRKRSKTFPGIAKAMAEQWAGEKRKTKEDILHNYECYGQMELYDYPDVVPESMIR
ncbi:DNA cytosine methyltransferase [Lacrimispora sp.]|uniref:DNA cytosine methyltransferase n=1 Tax=Lacrimispora sp. TaxID=2719234 RepID=UPI002687E19C|nr:DNA cytosine methyltransferase [Lacrimispora sp.]